MLAALIATASTGLSVPLSRAARATASATCSEVALTVGAKSTMSASIRGSASTAAAPRRTRRPSRRRACRRGSRSRSPPPGASPSAPRRSRLRGAAARARRPRRRRRTGCRPARVREHRHAAPARLGVVESSEATSTSSSSGAARITPAWRKRASTAASEPARAAVCELAARRPVALVPLFSASTGFARAMRRARRRSAAGAERLDVHEHELRRRVLLHHSSRSFVDVRLVADRHERGEPEPARLGGLQQREAEGAALGGEADVAARRGAAHWWR